MTLEEVIEKIQKLQALTTSSNPHEAALAASRAQKLMNEYKLDISDVSYDMRTEKEDNEPVETADGFLDRVENCKPWHQRLAGMIARENSCRIVVMIMCTKRDKAFQIVGRKSDVQIARYIYGYMKQEVLRISEKYCKNQTNTYRRHFRMGIVDTIHKIIAKDKEDARAKMLEAAASSRLQLIRVNKALERQVKRDQEVQKFVDDSFNKANGFTTSSVGRVNSQARVAGQVAGQETRITKARGALN